MAIFDSLKACCDYCGKPINKFEKRKISEVTGINFSYINDSIGVCPHCYSVIQYVANVANLSDDPTQTTAALLIMKNYKENFRREFLIRDNTTDVWLKSEMEKLLSEADGICIDYENYPDVINTTFDTIEQVVKKLPKKRIDCGTSTIACDEKNVYFMRYGNPVIENKKLFDIKEIKYRNEIKTEFIENVLKNKSLIQKISIDNIIYFQEKGEVNYSTSVSGGGGGGVSVGKAVIGGVLFGAAGAVVGGLMGNKVDAIKSEAVQHDDRYIVIRYLDGNDNTIEQQAPYEYYNAFIELIPEKEFNFVQMNVPSQETKVEVNVNTVPVNELKALKELLDVGIITREEFEIKKKSLLGL